MRDNVDLLRKDCEEADDKLCYTKDDLDNLRRVKDDSEHCLKQTIEDLQIQLIALGPSPCRHKALRHDSQSPSSSQS